MYHPFTPLPPELVRYIVSHAARTCPHTALALTLVSKSVRAWVDPILYHTVSLWTSHTVELFRVAFAAKPPAFFAKYVRNLLLNGEHGADIIQACHRIDRLAGYPPALLGLPEDGCDEHSVPCPSPMEITLMGTLDDVPWASPLFDNVKYLYLGLETPPQTTACDLSLLPSLTHCAFPYDRHPNALHEEEQQHALLLTISTLLESATLTHLLVLVNDDSEKGNSDEDRGRSPEGPASIWGKLTGVEDRRLFVGTEVCFDGEDWREMVENGVNMWDAWEKQCKGWRDV